MNYEDTTEEARQMRVQQAAERVLEGVRMVNSGLVQLDNLHDTETPYLDAAINTLDGECRFLRIIRIEDPDVEVVRAIRTMEQSKQERAEDADDD